MLNYLKFTRVRRNQCVRTVTSTFEETIDSRLNEGTFTAEEVKEMMSGKYYVLNNWVELYDHIDIIIIDIIGYAYKLCMCSL